MQTNKLEEYKSVIEEILNISKQTNKENSILYHFEISDNDIVLKISIIEKNGKEHVEKNLSIQNSSDFFQQFLIPLIKKFSDSNHIVLYDIVDMNEDNKITYRLITDNNDLFTINNLSFQDTNYICDVIEEIRRSKIVPPKDDLLKINNQGKASLALFLILVLFITLICSSIYFN